MAPLPPEIIDSRLSSADERILQHPAVSRVRAALSAHEVPGQIVVLDGHARTAAAAAEYLQVEIGQIANSLIFGIEDRDAPQQRRPLLILTSGAHRVDPGMVAALLETPPLQRVDADFVRERTGFAIGGVAPLGQLQPIDTLVDVALARYDQVWAAAGHPRTVFPTTFEELVRITGGRAAEVA